MNDVKKEIAGLKIRQQLLYILIFTFVTIIVWIFFSLFWSQRKAGIDPQLIQLAKTLNPNLDAAAIAELEAKNQYSSFDLANFPIYVFVISEDKRSEEKVPLNLR